MKRAISIVLAVAMLAAYQLPTLIAAAQNTGEIAGTAVVEGKPLGNVRVRLRNVDTRQQQGATQRTTDRGEFRFTQVPAGNFVVEVVDDRDNVLAVGAPFALAAGATVTVSVSVSAAAVAAAGVGAGAAAGAAGAAGAGAAGAAAAGTGAFFASTLGIITIAAVAAGVAVAAVAANDDPSPSQ